MLRTIAPIAGILLLMVLAGSLVYLLKGHNYEDFKKRLFYKTLCSMMFWLFGWIAAGYAGVGLAPFAIFMIMGFSLSVAGDVLLVYKNDQCFIFGLLSFFLAHVAYIVSFMMRYGFDGTSLLLFAVICLPVFIVINFSGLFRLGDMRILANLYLFILAFMLASAVRPLIFSPESLGAACLTSLGAFLFFVSDFTLAYEKFSKRGGLALEKPILITYYSAQILLALGMITFPI